MSAAAVRQTDVFKAAVLFARSEIILPAPESAHAIAYAIRKALECRETGEAKTIFFNLSGHGDFDLAAYEEYFAGRLCDFEYTDEMLEQGIFHHTGMTEESMNERLRRSGRFNMTKEQLMDNCLKADKTGI